MAVLAGILASEALARATRHSNQSLDVFPEAARELTHILYCYEHILFGPCSTATDKKLPAAVLQTKEMTWTGLNLFKPNCYTISLRVPRKSRVIMMSAVHPTSVLSRFFYTQMGNFSVKLWEESLSGKNKTIFVFTKHWFYSLTQLVASCFLALSVPFSLITGSYVCWVNDVYNECKFPAKFSVKPTSLS